MNFLKSLISSSAPTCVLCLEAESAALPLIVHDSVAFCAPCLAQYLHVNIVSNAKRSSPVLLAGPDKAHKAPFGVDFIRAHADAETLRVVDDVLTRTVPLTHPTALSDFGYSFSSSEGKLQPRFHFVTQTHYDAFGDLVAPYIQALMRDKLGMREVFLPQTGSPASNVFLTPDALTCDRLMLLIQGSGAVRAGQWARAVCLNDSLEMGSILPYLARAKKNGMGVVVFNPNLNHVEQPARVFTPADFLNPSPAPRTGVKRVPIAGSETPPVHCVTVWDTLVRAAAARDIVIVAHSAGGHCTMQLLREREDELMPRLRAIAFTDSVHSVSMRESKRVVDFFTKGDAQNWVQSDAKLDTPIQEQVFTGSAGCPCVSAGDHRHEYTSPKAIESVFAFLCRKLGQQYDGDVVPIDYSLPLFESAVSIDNDDNDDEN